MKKTLFPACLRLVFLTALVGLCWLGMQGVHELGHVLGAWLTGGVVTHVDWHPLRISQTKVQPNPHPGFVVWMGPLVGVALPVAAAYAAPARYRELRTALRFFAGFCLLANGAYISFGAADRVGDCGQMLKTGSPLWSLLAFGITSQLAGLAIWHSLGSPTALLRQPKAVGRAFQWTTVAAFVALVALLFLLEG